jgi:hypothetical protein
MEKFKTSFEFENGEILEQHSPITDPDFLFLVNTIKRLLEPVIIEGNMSGVIEIKVLEDKLKVNYINIEPYSYVPQLIEVIQKADSFANIDLN